MSNFQKILDSFSIKDTLNPKIWETPKEPNNAVMIPKVRKALMRIAEEFIDYLGDDVFVDDIHLTGSLANFNWSERPKPHGMEAPFLFSQTPIFTRDVIT